MYRSILGSLVAILFANILFAQTNELVFDVQETQAIYLGKTVEVRSLNSVELDKKTKKHKFKEARKKPANFPNRRGQSNAKVTALEHQGTDSLRQINSDGFPVSPRVNIFGLDELGSPTDPSGDIGLQYYVQAINATQIGVFDKFGNTVQVFRADLLWEELGSSSAGDPIILFDERAERWFITEFTDPANLLIAVSETSDPLASYNVYSFATPEFPDYPKYGLWPEALVVTTNEGGSGELHQYFIDRIALLEGREEVTMQRVEISGNNNTEAGFYVSTPIDIDGTSEPDSPNPIVMRLNDSSWGDSAQDQVELYEFQINWASADSTEVVNKSIPLSAFDSYPCLAEDNATFSCTPQKDGVTGLDALPELITNVPKYRRFDTHESIVFTFITDVTDGEDLSGIRWVELRKTAETDWVLHQEGTYAPDDNLHRFIPCIAMDEEGNIGLAYNVSSENIYAGIRFTGRYANDPLGVMSVREHTVADGVAPIQAGGRFGDYAHMSVDPIDNTTFWFTAEYAGGGEFATKTRIVAFELSRDTLDVAVASVILPSVLDSLTNDEQIEVQIINSGLDTIADFTLGLLINGDTISQNIINETLAPDSIYTQSFTGLDFAEKGDYDLEIFTNHPDDLKLGNNSYLSTLRSLYSYDAAIQVETTSVVCSLTDNIINLSITNNGSRTLETANFDILLNGDLLEAVTWEGSLALGETTRTQFNFDLPSGGTYELTTRLTALNGIADATPEDNMVSAEVIYSEDLESVSLRILTDFYPEETTWILTDENGDIIAENTASLAGLETTLITESFCLRSDGCYTFTIFDGYADGICCGYGEGNYEVVLPSGFVIFSSDGQFGGEESTEFCLDQLCNLQADIATADSDGTDNGAIFIDAVGGEEGSYLYSIDGGVTFQTEGTFQELAAGDYEVVVTLNNLDGCVYSSTISIATLSSTEEFLQDDLKVNLSPNPNNGLFNISIESPNNSASMLRFEILNADGRIIQSRKIGRYDGIYKGQISLVAQPKGLYYIRLIDQNHNRVFRVIVI